MRGRLVLSVVLLSLSLSAAPAAAEEPAPPTAPPPLDAALFSFVVDLAGASYVVIARPVPPEAAEGAPTVLTRETAAVRWPAAAKALTPAQAAWAGRAVAVRGRDGAARCRATVADLHVLLRYEPHFGTVAAWEGRGDDGDPAPDDAALAQEARETGAPRDWWLVGRLVPDAGQACDGGLWARAADQPAPPPVAAAAAPDRALRRAALQRLRALPEWKRIAGDYRTDRLEGKRAPHWDQHGGTQPRVHVMSGPGEVRWVWAGASVNQGCGAFFGSLWAVWEVRGGAKGTWTPLVTSTLESPWFDPLQAVDLDGDGRPELVGPRDLLRPVGPSWTPVESVEPSSYDCPC
jgi:hypothetical protein